MSSLERLGWSAFFDDQRQRLGLGAAAVARICAEQRGLYQVAGEFDGPAEIGGRFRHLARGPGDFPAVGDWVALRTGEQVPGSRFSVHGSGFSGSGSSGSGAGNPAVIDARFERRSALSRAAPGGGEQVLAANVDTVFLVTALTGDLNPRRLERYLTMVWNAGATPVVVLNKTDVADDPAAAVDTVRHRLPLVDVVAISALHDAALDALTPYLRPAATIALVGSSGVGKSTLVNRLLGRERQAVSALRESDGRGRHTTTSRQLFELPGGALLVDTPGLRELQLWSDEAGVAGAFDDIAALAADCRFADCAHDTEPGCAVITAVEGGRLDADRLENYRRLMREAAFEDRKRDPAAAAEQKRMWKQLHKAARAMYRQRGR